MSCTDFGKTHGGEAVNDEKLLKMALVHDIPETRTGDVNYLSRLYTSRNEELAAEDIFAKTSLETEMTELWKEYEARECLEAKLVKDADTLDVELEIMEQKAGGSQLMSHFEEFRNDRVYELLYTEIAKSMWKEIHATNPNTWHLSGRNRHTNGDWKPAETKKPAA